MRFYVALLTTLLLMQAICMGQDFNVELSVFNPHTKRATSTESVTVGSLDFVQFTVTVKTPAAYYDSTSFGLQARTNNSPYAKPELDNIGISITDENGKEVPESQIVLSTSGRGGGSDSYTLDLLLKIPTDLEHRVSRAKAYVRKTIQEDPQHRAFTQSQINRMVKSLSEQILDSKLGKYEFTITFTDPKTGAAHRSNKAYFVFVDNGFPTKHK